MKKSGLRIAAIVLSAIALVAFIIYIIIYKDDVTVLVANQSGSSSSTSSSVDAGTAAGQAVGTAVGTAVGFIILLLITFVLAAIVGVFAGISLGFSVNVLKKRDIYGKAWLSTALVITDSVMLLGVISTLISLWII